MRSTRLGIILALALIWLSLTNGPSWRHAAAAGSVPAAIIPADRAIDWRTAGIPGGIPRRDEICASLDNAAYGDGLTDATAAIQQAIDACPAGEVVYLPPGTYLTSDTTGRGVSLETYGAGGRWYLVPVGKVSV